LIHWPAPSCDAAVPSSSCRSLLSSGSPHFQSAFSLLKTGGFSDPNAPPSQAKDQCRVAEVNHAARPVRPADVGVVIITMPASAVTLPAALALLGHRVNAGRLRRSRPVRAVSDVSPFLEPDRVRGDARPLVGHSFGVLLACALAAELETSGRQAARLVTLAGASPQAWHAELDADRSTHPDADREDFVARRTARISPWRRPGGGREPRRVLGGRPARVWPSRSAWPGRSPVRPRCAARSPRSGPPTTGCWSPGP
jgi:hypothetical protein